VLVAWKYRPRDTFIQRLDPRARLTYLACIILAISGTDVWDIRYVLPLFALTMILYFLARIEWQDVWRAWVFILVLVFVIVGVNALLFGRGGPTSVLRDQSPVFIQFPTLHIPLTPWSINLKVTEARVFFALVQITRMLTMAALAIPIPYTLDPSLYGVTFRPRHLHRADLQEGREVENIRAGRLAGHVGRRLPIDEQVGRVHVGHPLAEGHLHVGEKGNARIGGRTEQPDGGRVGIHPHRQRGDGTRRRARDVRHDAAEAGPMVA